MKTLLPKEKIKVCFGYVLKKREIALRAVSVVHIVFLLLKLAGFCLRSFIFVPGFIAKNIKKEYETF